MQDEPKNVLADARHIVRNPEDHIDQPELFTAAWAALKAGRGQGFDPARLRPMHIVVRPEPAPEPTDQTLERTRAKIRAMIEAKGYRPRRRAA
ncbi:hypothetical protein [Pseudodonghicola flavimaris]|uniref:Uncharacterized protein n=1 Tax=Pseudodonghicola flavimaris TaxID=3050036 RepID=A0ABT7EZ13_9RHOB|nr:hypothetical protein [Pseudodonghicola flavimaris]MDK3017604.1 hypothetical protein [Pseudodonghicola flavimaris]